MMVEEDMNMIEEFKSQLRSHMGFGNVDKSTISLENMTYSARIFADGDLAHEMTWNGKEYTFSGYFNGEKTSSTVAEKGKDALLKYFWYTDFSQDPRSRDLVDRISKMNNIKLFIPTKNTHSNSANFPAGFLMKFYIILNKENRHLIETLKLGGGSKKIKFYPAIKTKRIFLFTLDISFRVHVESVKVAEFMCALSSVYKYAELINEIGITLKLKKYKTLIKNSCDGWPFNPLKEKIFTNVGNVYEGYLTYGWLIRMNDSKSVNEHIFAFKRQPYRLLKERDLI